MKLLFDFMPQKLSLLQTNHSMFSAQLRRQTPHALFQRLNIKSHTCPIYMNRVRSSIAVDDPTHRMLGREV